MSALSAEKALVGYCAVHHILLTLGEEYPDIFTKATEKVKMFMQRPNDHLVSNTVVLELI